MGGDKVPTCRLQICNILAHNRLYERLNLGLGVHEIVTFFQEMDRPVIGKRDLGILDIYFSQIRSPTWVYPINWIYTHVKRPSS